MLIRDVDDFSFLMLPLPGFNNRVMLASEKELGNIPPFLYFLEDFEDWL